MTTADRPDAAPSERTILAVGEAKAGEAIRPRHLDGLAKARAALGTRAATAKLLLFAPAFTAEVAHAARRTDVELIDLERLYHGE